MPDDLRITVNEVRDQLNAGRHFSFIDTRNPQAWSDSDTKIPGALRIPAAELEQHLSEIPKDEPVVTYCT
jgi:rhodanese-related sulfurtransferase